MFSALGGYVNGVVAVSKHRHIHSQTHDIGNLASLWAGVFIRQIQGWKVG